MTNCTEENRNAGTGFIGRSPQRACALGITRPGGVMSWFGTTQPNFAHGTTGHTKVYAVAWHRAYTPAMHHHRRPEEVASH